MLTTYIQAAMHQAKYEILSDDGSLYGEIPGFQVVMKKLTKLTQLELMLLELVNKGEGKWSWYEIANALSRRDVPREPDMMVVLKKLAGDGLVKRYVEIGSPRDRWELTSEGNIILTEEIEESKKE